MVSRTTRWLGKIPYDVAMGVIWNRKKIVSGGLQERIYCLEHPPVITLGKRGTVSQSLAEWSRDDSIPIIRTDRGGLATYHGPGQLIIYPVVSLRAGVVDFLAGVSSVIVEALNDVGVSGGEWRRDPAGVWIGDRKVASCGIRISKRIVTHGFSVNLNVKADVWKRFSPCGLDSSTLTSAVEHGAESLSVAEFARQLIPKLDRWHAIYVGSL